jgi:hypothetical protein
MFNGQDIQLCNLNAKFLRNPNLNKIKLQYDWTGNGDLIIIPYGILLDLPHSNNEKGEVSEYIYNFN